MLMVLTGSKRLVRTRAQAFALPQSRARWAIQCCAGTRKVWEVVRTRAGMTGVVARSRGRRIHVEGCLRREGGRPSTTLQRGAAVVLIQVARQTRVATRVS